MAILCLDSEFESRALCDLHEWLRGDWGLLFSHPEDFAQRGRHQDRWLDDLRYEFGSRAVRTLAIKRNGGPLEGSWIDELACDQEVVRLREPPFAASDAVSFAARTLRGIVLTMQSRFVLIIDGSLRNREILKYSSGRGTLSAFDLLASVDARRRAKATVIAA